MTLAWSRSDPARAAKESHEIFPIEQPLVRRTFVPSYDKEPPAMSLLLGWEYGRVWLQEHHEMMTRILSKSKPQFIEPNFDWWVSKRNATLDRRALFVKSAQNAHAKNCNMSAFAQSKVNRQLRSKSLQAGSSGVAELAAICNCKDCKQRRCKGGFNKGLGKAAAQAERFVKSMPWY
ncbi:uncharacterized protein LOC108601060 [Drosophila busckii]|uniref:uncharacterized protein LOC108601060 n=1 Tax=Drosophila busckii TaxID=30019 RepID=UPI00083EB1E8|nr:uncharacterized protein LOC108601060 [Drosophila busckii]